MEKRIGEKVARVELIASSLSIEAQEMREPIVEGEHPRCRDFGGMIVGEFK